MSSHKESESGVSAHCVHLMQDVMQGSTVGLPGIAAADQFRAGWHGRFICYLDAALLRRQRASARNGAVRTHVLLQDPPVCTAGKVYDLPFVIYREVN